MSKRNENKPGYWKSGVGWIPNTWDCLTLESIASNLHAGVSVNSYDEQAQGNSLGVLKTSAVTNGYFRPGENKRIQEKEIKRAKVAPLAESIIISRMNTRDLVGANAFINDDYTTLRLPDRLWQMRISDSNSFHPRWLGYLMASPRMRSILSNRATGTSGSMKNISKRAVLTIKVQNPPFPEQKKIAEILSVWDRAIEQTQKLIAAKKQLKKGLMQQLLTGRMRFTELCNPNNNKNRCGYQKTKLGWLPADWEVKPLDFAGSFSKGKGITNAEKKAEGLPCITYGEIYTKHEYVIKDFYSFIDLETAKKSQQIESNSILFAGSGETADEIGKCVAYTKNKTAYAGGDIIIFQPNEMNSSYLVYVLNSDLILRHKRKLGQGNSVVHIYTSSLKKMYIPIPPMREQKKIAETLSVTDKEIDLLLERASLFVEQKKGLMQKLLTGEVRVKIDKQVAQ